MRRARWLQVVLFSTTLTFGQTTIDLRTQSKSVDFSGANTTKPLKSGTALPVTCGIGEMFYLTSAPSGANVYGCTATNAWSMEGATGLPATSGNAGKTLSTDGTNYTWTANGGDITGSVGSTTVTQIQGRPVSNAAPATSQILGWNGISWVPQNPPTVPALPTPGGNAGKSLSTDGTNFVFTALSGDVSGAASSLTVTRLQGRPMANIAPVTNQLLGWSGAAWVPQNPPTGGGPALPTQAGNAGKSLSTDGTNFVFTALSGDVSGSLGSTTVTQLQGRPVSNTAPLTNQILGWSGSTWVPQNAPTGGGGGGATMATQLGDFLVVRTSSTTLTVGSNCSATTPCNVRFGTLLYAFTSGATVTVSSGTGLAFIYVTNTGALTVGHTLGLTCSGCVAQSGVAAFPADTVPIFSWSATNGTWDTLGLDQRAFLSFKEVTSGTGITVAPDAQGHTIISTDSSVVPLRTTVPPTSSTACTPGAWATDTSFFYICVTQNHWLRSTLLAW